MEIVSDTTKIRDKSLNFEPRPSLVKGCILEFRFFWTCEALYIAATICSSTKTCYHNHIMLYWLLIVFITHLMQVLLWDDKFRLCYCSDATHLVRSRERERAVTHWSWQDSVVNAALAQQGAKFWLVLWTFCFLSRGVETSRCLYWKWAALRGCVSLSTWVFKWERQRAEPNQ